VLVGAFQTTEGGFTLSNLEAMFHEPYATAFRNSIEVSLVTAVAGGALGFLIVVNLVVFVLGCFIDFFEIAFIVVPLLAPVAAKLGIDLVWFGLMICANIQTSFMHPPFGFALFYLRGVAPPTVRTADIYWGAVPWVMLQIILVAILIMWPQSVTYFIDRGPKVDPSKIQMELPLPDLPPPPPIGLDPIK
jgi:TRAP-type mannitol/chloroaromatic compound transport system permease large subunit